MSRVAKNPVSVPKGIEILQEGSLITVKNTKDSMRCNLPGDVEVSIEDGVFHVSPSGSSKNAGMMAGTVRALVNNMVHGLSNGFEKKLILKGVGYRAQMQGNVLNLTLGLSHPVNFQVPDGINIDVPSQTEIIVKGFDKQRVGQVASDIRSFRPPEPYKGKGIQYANEVIVLKEAKKK